MSGKKRKIGQKVNGLLFFMVSVTMLLAGGISVYSLYSVKEISTENGRMLGETAAGDSERALEELAAQHLLDTAIEKAAYIEEKFAAVEAYVLGMAKLAEDIYAAPDNYPDRPVELPVRGSGELAAQLLWSEKIIKAQDGEGGGGGEGREGEPGGEAGYPLPTEELLKLGNVQDLLVQYNAHNDMVSSTYIATMSGWMIQADYIAYSKYRDGSTSPLPYEAAERQWFQLAEKSGPGQVVYTDVIKDIHEGGDCIVCASPIYRQGKVVAVAGVGSYLTTVNEAVLDTVIGQEGYAFLVNGHGQVMVSGRKEGETAAYAEQRVDLRESANAELAEAAAGMMEGGSDFLRLALDGREVYMAYAPLQRLGWSFATVIDVAEVIAPAQESQDMILSLTEDMADRQDGAIRRMLLVFLGGLAAVMPFIGFLGTVFSAKITEPIRELTREVAKIDGGNLDYRIHIATGDEIEDLGCAFNGMAEQIRKYVENLASVTAERERIRTEIQVASRLQADMLPEVSGVFAERKEFMLAASMTPAKGVGGDFYDFFLLDDNHLALVIADVSGKGVPAALFMVVSRTLIRSHVVKDVPLEQVVQEINDSLCDNNKNDMFVTAWIGILTLSTGELSFVNAGHCRPLIRKQNGLCSFGSKRGGLVLAGMEGTPYSCTRMRLRQGDTLFLYTDGVTEATSRGQELYGEERLREIVEDGGRTPEELLEGVREDVDRFQSGAEQFDDITMLAVTFRGNGFAEKTGEPDMESIREFTGFADAVLHEKGVSVKTIVKLQMAVDEIFSNICYYSGAKEITLGVKVEDQTVIMYFEDDGAPYNPLERQDPDVEELLEDREIGGLGIYLVKKRMDRTEYEYAGGMNRLTIVKKDGVE